MDKQMKWVTAHMSSFHSQENKKRKYAELKENLKTFKNKVYVFWRQTLGQVMHRIYAFMSLES